MEIVYSIPTKTVMCADVSFFLLKGLRERLYHYYVRNSCTYNGTPFTILIVIEMYYLDSILKWFGRIFRKELN